MEEKMSDKLVVCMGKGAQKDLAVSLAKKINVPLVEKLGGTIDRIGGFQRSFSV